MSTRRVIALSDAAIEETTIEEFKTGLLGSLLCPGDDAYDTAQGAERHV